MISPHRYWRVRSRAVLHDDCISPHGFFDGHSSSRVEAVQSRKTRSCWQTRMAPTNRLGHVFTMPPHGPDGPPASLPKLQVGQPIGRLFFTIVWRSAPTCRDIGADSQRRITPVSPPCIGPLRIYMSAHDMAQLAMSHVAFRSCGISKPHRSPLASSHEGVSIAIDWALRIRYRTPGKPDLFISGRELPSPQEPLSFSSRCSLLRSLNNSKRD